MRLESNNLNIQDDLISLNEGWNLIGPKYEIKIINIQDNDNILFDKKFYELDLSTGYTPVDILESKKAYWIKAKKEGILIFNYNGKILKNTWGKITQETPTIDVAIFVAEPEAQGWIFFMDTIRTLFLPNFIINPVTVEFDVLTGEPVHDHAVNKNNIIEKFFKYYDQGIRYFISYNYSSILGVLNEKFILLEEELSNRINFDELVFVEIGSTAVNLLSSTGEVMNRSRFIKRMVANDALPIQIIKKKFLKEYNKYDEAICLYANDSYGIPYHEEFVELTKNLINYKAFPINNNDNVLDAVNYINSSNKNLYIINIFYIENILSLLTNLIYNKDYNKKLLFTESLAFSDQVVYNSKLRDNLIQNFFNTLDLIQI